MLHFSFFFPSISTLPLIPENRCNDGWQKRLDYFITEFCHLAQNAQTKLLSDIIISALILDL